jgi:hypothetical protein
MTPGAALPKKLQDSGPFSVVLPLCSPGLGVQPSTLNLQMWTRTHKLSFFEMLQSEPSKMNQCFRAMKASGESILQWWMSGWLGPNDGGKAGTLKADFLQPVRPLV